MIPRANCMQETCCPNMFHDFFSSSNQNLRHYQKLGTEQFFHIPFTPLLIIKFNSAELKLSNFVRIKNFSICSDHAVQPNTQKLQRKLRWISCTYPFFTQSYKHSSLGVKVHDFQSGGYVFLPHLSLLFLNFFIYTCISYTTFYY
jgi:hypothetical protein